jgi:hypothetical protein
MKRKFNELLIIGITGTAIFGSIFAVNYGETVWGNKDIWWTPISMALPLNETKQEIELYIKGELLQKHLERGTLIAVGKEGQSSPLVANDVNVRLNNWNKIKASKLNNVTVSSLFLGVSLTLLVMGFIQYFKKEKIN